MVRPGEALSPLDILRPRPPNTWTNRTKLLFYRTITRERKGIEFNISFVYHLDYFSWWRKFFFFLPDDTISKDFQATYVNVKINGYLSRVSFTLLLRYYSDLMMNMHSLFLFLRPRNKLMVGIFNMYRILKWLNLRSWISRIARCVQSKFLNVFITTVSFH